jgi:hypothetical protein
VEPWCDAPHMTAAIVAATSPSFIRSIPVGCTDFSLGGKQTERPVFRRVPPCSDYVVVQDRHLPSRAIGFLSWHFVQVRINWIIGISSPIRCPC